MTWQEMAAISTVGVGVVTIVGFIIAFYTNIHVRIKALEIEVKSLQEAQQKTDGKFDMILEKIQLGQEKTETKIDALLEKMQNVNIALNNKVDKHN